MTGAYRCQATTSEQKNKAISSEFNINVVGIEKISTIHHHLPFGQLGHIEVEFYCQVCANPKPELFWLTPDAIITPHVAGTSHYSVTHLHHKKIRLHRDGPATIVPYCYTSRLLIRNVSSSEEFQLLVKGETESRTVNLPIKILNVPSITVPRSPLMLGLIIMISSQL
ncbi:hypothetical protein OSTOST_25580 [Ostertagia ostertagi]